MRNNRSSALIVDCASSLFWMYFLLGVV
uniref:Uncharacterized protein n=1 Tax=Arundo donax TaxID=35708 RepID=A0A0A8XXT1_ARUDO